MSLYHKFRPKSFADVVGQEHIVTTLEHAAERDQLVHAYLFFGPRGTGKTSVARILAKILLIRGIEDEVLSQQIIKSVDDGTMVDLIEIDAATNRQIDDVRDLKEKVTFAPNIASAKVYIIDEVHMMTKEAFNALLKTLEEPPPHAFFILATTELHKVPDTIQSRCQRFPFREISEENIVRALQNIADTERIPIDRGALRAIARHVGGGMRDAISLMDQLSSLEKITEEDVKLRIGESAEELVEELWQAILDHDRKSALAMSASLEENGVSLEVFLRQLLSRARKDFHEHIEKNMNTDPAIARIDAVFRALRDLRVSPVPHVALEVAIVDLCSDGMPKIDISEREKKRDTTKVKDEKSKPTKRDPEASNITKEEDAKDSATVVAPALTKEECESCWKEIVANVPSASIRMSLKDAVIADVNDGKIVLSFASKFHRDKVNEAKALHELEDVVKRHFCVFVPVMCILQTEASDVTNGGEKRSVNVVEAVAEIFG